jgi:DNA-binding XRE family transcriptional regulator
MPTLAQLRERAMLAQSEVAALCGVATHTVYYWEAGRRVPRLKQQRRLVEALHCTPDELRAALKETKVMRERREQQDKERPAA